MRDPDASSIARDGQLPVKLAALRASGIGALQPSKPVRRRVEGFRG